MIWQSGPKLSRRTLLGALSLTAVAPVLQACGGAATTTSQSTGAPTAASTAAMPASSATTVPAATPAAASGAKISLGIAVRSDAQFTWQTDAAKQFAKEHPNVDLSITQVQYTDMAKKQLTMLATGTMPDVVFSGAKWYSYSAYKGAFLAIDDLIKQGSTNIDDFFPSAIASCKLDGKLYGLPYTLNTGNTNIILYNRDLLGAAGAKEPSDGWTMDDFVATAAKVTNPQKRVFGTDLLPSSYYDLATWARTLGGDILSADGKQFTLATDPKTAEAARWITEIRTKSHAAPGRADSQGIEFAAGQIGLSAGGTYTVSGMGKAIGDKFKWDVVLAPVGPDGRRGYEIFVSMFSLYSMTKHVPEAFSLLAAELSPQTANHAFVDQGLPPALASVWSSADAQKISPIYGRVAKWLADGTDKGPFPMPDNLRFSELDDKFTNLMPPVYYGEVAFDQGLQQVQTECGQIVALPRG